MTTPNNPPPEIAGEAITPGDQFWLDTAREAAKQSPAALEEAAKQLIAIAGFAQTIYFAAISFGDVKKSLDLLTPEQQKWFIAALIVPLIFWIASLAFATRVFTPQVYDTNFDSPDLARETCEKMARYKHENLKRALWLLAIGFLPMLANLFVYLAFIPVKQSQ
ncbi:MAG TPA: hypothetical protein VID27_17215 [Blastocatellia bacterium]|jgi:hypothetical protein